MGRDDPAQDVAAGDGAGAAVGMDARRQHRGPVDAEIAPDREPDRVGGVAGHAQQVQDQQAQPLVAAADDDGADLEVVVDRLRRVVAGAEAGQVDRHAPRDRRPREPDRERTRHLSWPA